MRTKIGIVTPSSNTILEPVSSSIASSLSNVSVHFARFHVTEISDDQKSIEQFANSAMLMACQMLSEARVDCIIWSGTSAGWLGFYRDIELCNLITQETGIRSSSSTLALKKIMDINKHKSFGLVTPYTHKIQEKIIENFLLEGYDCISERHYNEYINYNFSEISNKDIASMIRDVSKNKPDCITTFCTNLNAAPLVNALEEEIQIDIYDTVTLALWEAFNICNINYKGLENWGKLFSY